MPRPKLFAVANVRPLTPMQWGLSQRLASNPDALKPGQPREAYEKQPSAEMRYRLQNLLARLKDAPNEETAKVRAVQVLETIGAGEARTFLETLAKGPPGSRVTQEAKASLQRLNAPPSP